MTRRSSTHLSTRVTAYQLRTLTGREHALLTGRATAGIEAALRVMGFQNRTVLIPANTCYIVLWAVIRSGNIPYLVDIDPLTGNITLQTLDQARVGNPAAVIPCHLYGIPAPMQAICEWAKQHNAVVIEDSALAIGTHADEQPVGSWGEVSVFSFGAGKIVDAEFGGVALTDDPVLAKALEQALSKLPMMNARLRELNAQWLDIYWALHQYESVNPKLPTLYKTLYDIYQPLVGYRLPLFHWSGSPKGLDQLNKNLDHRRKTAALYDSYLLKTDCSPLFTISRSNDAALWRYPIFVDPARRAELLKHLWANEIDATMWYPPLNLMRSVLMPDLAPCKTPHADRWSASVINLPVDEGVTAEDVRRISALICEFFG